MWKVHYWDSAIGHLHQWLVTSRFYACMTCWKSPPKDVMFYGLQTFRGQHVAHQRTPGQSSLVSGLMYYEFLELTWQNPCLKWHWNEGWRLYYDGIVLFLLAAMFAGYNEYCNPGFAPCIWQSFPLTSCWASEWPVCHHSVCERWGRGGGMWSCEYNKQSAGRW